MLAAQTELRYAEKVRLYLQKQGLLHPGHNLVKEFNYIYFPLLQKAKVPGAKVLNTKFSFPVRLKAITVDELLRDKLTAKEQAQLPRAQEIVGKIMILEIPSSLRKKEKIIAQAYLQQNKSIETVVKKGDIHTGEYRLRKVQVLAGKNSKETVHHENGVEIKLDLEKTYFSARLGNERLRIARQVKKGESVLVMFSGAAPYPLVLARHSPAKEIYGIEINPLAHQYAVENVSRNGFLDRIIVLQGDVRKVIPSLKKKFDRIVMPLPKTGEQFLDLALSKIKSSGIIHFYAFVAEADIPAEKLKIKRICQEYGYTAKIIRTTLCGKFSPRISRVCLDLNVKKIQKIKK